MPTFGHDKVQKKLYDMGRERHVDELLPYEIQREVWKGTLDEDNKTLTTNTVTAGRQLKILFLRVWSEYTGTTVFKLKSTAQTGDLGKVPAGVFDYPMLEAAGAEVVGPVPLDYPVHVVEGSWVVQIQDPDPADAAGSKFGVVWWGVEKTFPED